MKIGGLVENTNLTMYRITSIEDKPGAAGEILQLFAEENVKLPYITESGIANDGAVMTICISTAETDIIDHFLEEHKDQIRQISISKISPVSVIGIYGPHFRDKPILPATFCRLLGQAGINILALSSSISSISSVICSEQLQTAKTALLKEFELP
jgi:aspartokinase